MQNFLADTPPRNFCGACIISFCIMLLTLFCHPVSVQRSLLATWRLGVYSAGNCDSNFHFPEPTPKTARSFSIRKNLAAVFFFTAAADSAGT